MSLTAIDTAKLARNDGLAKELRRLADAAERGDVECFAACWSENNRFDFLREGSDQETLVLGVLLQDWALRRLKG
jgi:hypothetical protein